MPTIITQSQQRVMRWKNGGGMTCEIVRFPEDSSLESFDWRVSMATVHQGGAFSQFPGVDRSLVILEGQGLLLEMDGVEQRLTPQDPVLCFDGAASVNSSLIMGSTVDFNVMTRRTMYRHTLERLFLPASEHCMLPVEGEMMLAYVVNGRIRLQNGRTLQAGDALLLHAGEEVCPLNSSAAELILVQLFHNQAMRMQA